MPRSTGGHFSEISTVMCVGGQYGPPRKNSQSNDYYKPLLMIMQNQKPPFWRQNLTVSRHLPVNPSFCSVGVGDSFMNNFIQNCSHSVWKYTKYEHYDIMWRIMTSPSPILIKMLGWYFRLWWWLMTIFEVNWINRKEMANVWKIALKTTLRRYTGVMMTSAGLFWLFPKFDVQISFQPKNHNFCGFYGGHL